MLKIPQRRFSYQVALCVIASLYVTVTYNACSKVDFAASEEAVSTRLSAGGLVVVNGGAMFTNDVNVTLTLKADNGTEMYVTNKDGCDSGGTWEPISANKPWVIAQQNAKAVVFAKFRSSELGSTESSCFQGSIVHDNVVPTLVMTKTMPAYTNAANSLVQFIAADTLSGVDSVSCMDVVKNVSIPCTESIIENGINEGTHTYKLVVKDRAGNSAPPVVQTFVVDRTKPVAALNSAPANPTGNTVATFTFSATDAASPISSFECKIDGGAYAACTSPFTSAALVAGSHTFAVHALDAAGNFSDDASYAWSIDLTAPVITISKSPGAFDKNPTPSFEFSGTDSGKPITKFVCKVDSGTYASCTSPFTAPTLTTETSHTFSVRGTDDYGNQSAPVSVSWVLDLTKPAIAVTQQPAPFTNLATATLAFTATDKNGIVTTECKLDSAAYGACVSPINLSGLLAGTHTFMIHSVDKAGNESFSPAITWVIDQTPPTVSVTSTTPAMTNSTSVTVAIAANDNSGSIASVMCKLDGATDFSSCTTATTDVHSGLKAGDHIIVVKIVDSAGNISDTSLASSHFAWTIDTSGPTITWNSFPDAINGPLEQIPIDFAVTDSPAGVASVKCTLKQDQQTEVPNTCASGVPQKLSNLAVGSYVYKVTATDNVGNVSNSTQSFKVSNTLVQQNQLSVVSLVKKVDVLVVIDNSQSMKEEQANMANRFKSFLDQLQGLDWQVGIVTTDLSTGTPNTTRQGRLVPMVGGTGPNAYMLNSAMNIDAAKTIFGNTIQRPIWEIVGGPDPGGVVWDRAGSAERGIAASLASLRRATTPTEPNDQNNKALFRDGAALAIVVVTDAQESGTDADDKPETLLDYVSATWSGSKSLAFHSIVVPTTYTVVGNTPYVGKADPCYGKRESPNFDGRIYLDASKKTGGIAGDVCADDYGSQLSSMGKGTADLVRTVTLKCKPVDLDNDGKPDVVFKTPDNSPVGNYTVNGVTVTLDNPLPVGTTKITYSCYK